MACGDRFICSHGPACNCFQYYARQCAPSQTGRMDMSNNILEARVKGLEDKMNDLMQMLADTQKMICLKKEIERLEK